MADESLFNVPPTDAPLTAAQIVEQLREKVGSTDFDALTNEVSSYETLLSAWEAIKESERRPNNFHAYRKARTDATELLGGNDAELR